MKNSYKYLLLLTGSIFACCLLSAQNYRPFLPGLTYVYQVEYEVGFQDSIKALHSLRIDSVYAEGGDSIFVFNKIGRPGGQGIRVNQHNILGEVMLEKLGGIYQFVGMDSDTFVIQTQRSLMDSWEYEVGTGIMATLLDRSVQSFLGITDSVLTIFLSSGDTLLISQNYGLIEGQVLFPFRAETSIPMGLYSYLSIEMMKQKLRLWGIEEFLIGQKLPWFHELYNFEVGDLFLSRDASSCSDEGFTYVWREVLERWESPNQDTLKYVMEIEKTSILPGWQNPPTYLPDTIFQGTSQIEIQYTEIGSELIGPISGTMIPRLLSNEYFLSSNLLLQGPFFLPQLNDRLVYSFNGFFSSYDSATNSYFNFEGGIVMDVGEGLGTVNYRWSSELPILAQCFECYQKLIDSSETCFTPEMLVSNDGLIPDGEFNIYPNPVRDQLTIEWEGITPRTGEMQLLDLSGRRLKKDAINFSREGKMSWKVSDISVGIYLLQVRSEGRSLWSQRVVIMR